MNNFCFLFVESYHSCLDELIDENNMTRAIEEYVEVLKHK
jgi:hypothetical protein